MFTRVYVPLTLSQLFGADLQTLAAPFGKLRIVKVETPVSPYLATHTCLLVMDMQLHQKDRAQVDFPGLVAIPGGLRNVEIF